jgi:hypothetical protein
MFLNKKKRALRVRNGKPATLKDLSMESKYLGIEWENENQGGVCTGDNGECFSATFS